MTEDSVHALLGHLVGAYVLQTVPLHTASERQRNSNPRKIFPADAGLIHAFDASGRANTGHALETAVSVKCGRWPMLRRRNRSCQQRYWS